MGHVLPDLFATIAVPKAEELVATPYRHVSKEEAERFFLDGMTLAMQRLADHSHPGVPLTIYYAFKQSESNNELGISSTGWETFLDAVIRAGFSVSGTWPMRTENTTRLVGMAANALASSIVLVCRPLAADALTATRREFRDALKSGPARSIAQDAARQYRPGGPGPGRHWARDGNLHPLRRVLDAGGKAVSVREALALINETLDEVLAEQEGDFDADTRWALAWFDQSGFSEGSTA